MSEAWGDPGVEAMLEDDLEALVVELAKWLKILRYHTHRSDRSEAGLPDEILLGPRGLLWRELKRQKAKPTKAQQRWLDALLAAGEDADVWRPEDWFSGRIRREMSAIAGRRTV